MISVGDVGKCESDVRWVVEPVCSGHDLVLKCI